MELETTLRQNRIDAAEAKKQEEFEIEQAKREKHSPYQSFVQLNMDKQVMAAMSTMAKNSSAMRVFLFITQYMDGYNAVVTSYKVIGEGLGMSKPTVTRAVKYLVDNHFLYVIKSGTGNVYLINPDIVWKSYGKNKRFCQFPAIVLAAESEQKVKENKVKTVTIK